MRTTFACREFMDEPMPNAALYRILDAARFAPSGGNRQGWRVLVVRDGKVRERMGGLPESFALAATVPLGRPKRILTRLRRDPVESFARLERWDGEALRP